VRQPLLRSVVELVKLFRKRIKPAFIYGSIRRHRCRQIYSDREV